MISQIRRGLRLSLRLKFRAIVAGEPVFEARPELLALRECRHNGDGDSGNQQRARPQPIFPAFEALAATRRWRPPASLQPTSTSGALRVSSL
jgi:hypothetical protein